MSKWTKFGAVAVALVVAAGCGDDNGPGGSDLSQAEKTALVNALQNTEFGSLAAYVVQVVGQVGTLDATTATSAVSAAMANALSLSSTGSLAASYEGAVGIALQFDYDVQGDVFQGWFYGVFGWNNINTSAGTVGEWVLVGGFGEDASLPTSASGTIEDLDVFADYSNNNVAYYGTSGEASISSSSFSGSTDCSASQGGISVDCTYAVGTMNGNFRFDAMQVSGTGTYTQTPVEFTNLPALRMILTITQ